MKFCTGIFHLRLVSGSVPDSSLTPITSSINFTEYSENEKRMSNGCEFDALVLSFTTVFPDYLGLQFFRLQVQEFPSQYSHYWKFWVLKSTYLEDAKVEEGCFTSLGFVNNIQNIQLLFPDKVLFMALFFSRILLRSIF